MNEHWYGPDKGYDGPSFEAGRSHARHDFAELVEAAKDLLGWMEYVEGQNRQWHESHARATAALAKLDK